MVRIRARCSSAAVSSVSSIAQNIQPIQLILRPGLERRASHAARWTMLGRSGPVAGSVHWSVGASQRLARQRSSWWGVAVSPKRPTSAARASSAAVGEVRVTDASHGPVRRQRRRQSPWSGRWSTAGFGQPAQQRQSPPATAGPGEQHPVRAVVLCSRSGSFRTNPPRQGRHFYLVTPATRGREKPRGAHRCRPGPPGGRHWERQAGEPGRGTPRSRWPAPPIAGSVSGSAPDRR